MKAKCQFLGPRLLDQKAVLSNKFWVLRQQDEPVRAQLALKCKKV